MKLSGTLFFCLLLAAAIGNGHARSLQDDPYQIWGRYLAAQGGRDKLKAVTSQFVQGSIQAPGLQGTFKEWHQDKVKSRQDIDLQVFRQVEGSNGQVNWTMDANGKVQIHLDEKILKRKQVEALMLDPDNLKPGSSYFKLLLKGREKVGTADCYVIVITNTINADKMTYFINSETFLPEKTIAATQDIQAITRYADYREVSGIKVSYKMEMETQPASLQLQINIQLAEIGGKIDSTLFDPPNQDVQDFTFAAGDRAENVPFQFIEKHLYIPVSINDKEKLWIIDSGASMSVIDQDFVAEIGLTPSGKIKGQGAGKTVDVSFVELPSFQVAGIRFQSQKIASIPLRSLFESHMGFAVAGILGYDFLSRFVTRIDFANQRISFYHPDHFTYNGPGKIIPAPLKSNMFHVDLTVDKKWTGAFMLDIGAGSTGLNYPFAVENKLLKRKGLDCLAIGAGGGFLERRSRFQSLNIGGFEIPKPLLDFPSQKPEGAFASKENMGNLGNDTLRRFILFLDYKNQKIILEAGPDFARQFPTDRSGAAISNAGTGQLTILFVAPRSPAAQAGLKKDDIITQVDGQDAISFNGLPGLRELFTAPAGKSYKLTIRRQQQQKTLTLKLRDLL